MLSAFVRVTRLIFQALLSSSFHHRVASVAELCSEHHYLSALFAQSHLHCAAFSRGVELYQSMKTLGASNANRYHSYRP